MPADPRGSEGPPLASSLSSEAELRTSPWWGTRTAGPDPRVRLAVVLALLADRAPREAGTGLHIGPSMGAAAGGLRRRQEPSPSKAGDAHSPGLPGSGVGAAALCCPRAAGPWTPSRGLAAATRRAGPGLRAQGHGAAPVGVRLTALHVARGPSTRLRGRRGAHAWYLASESSRVGCVFLKGF